MAGRPLLACDMAADHSKFFDQLEEDGEDKVRTLLASGAIYGSDKKGLVVEWLARKDEERRAAALAAEMEIVRSAKDAAWAAADAARDAAEAAKVANRIAGTAKATAQLATAAALVSSIMSIIALLVANARL